MHFGVLKFFPGGIMRVTLMVATLLTGFFLSGNAVAWSSNGHQAVGAIADNLLHGSHAEAEVKAILGAVNNQPLTLEQVAVWPDCVRGIHPAQNFAYDPGKYHEAACAIFEDAAGIQAMADYAKRNNTNCKYSGKNFECHKAFHFTDVDIAHNDYSEKYVGTSNYDVVHAIGAAIDVLQDKPAPAPFNIASKKEALMLLTHFAGDLHQPLHVAAIYLDANGKAVNADEGTFDPATDTFGGNGIVGRGGNLHHQWDSTMFALDDQNAIDDLAEQAKQLGGTDGSYEKWPKKWADDSVVEAHKAFDGVNFGAKTQGWPMTFTDREAYIHQKSAIQKRQVIKGGAHLAALLKAIWPE